MIVPSCPILESDPVVFAATGFVLIRESDLVNELAERRNAKRPAAYRRQRNWRESRPEYFTARRIRERGEQDQHPLKYRFGAVVNINDQACAADVIVLPNQYEQLLLAGSASSAHLSESGLICTLTGKRIDVCCQLKDGRLYCPLAKTYIDACCCKVSD